MPFLALFSNLSFYHFSLLSFILGAQLYQSFLANITASNALTRGQFRILQAAIWPMYFKLQTIVSMLLALTYPGGHEEGAALFSGSASLPGLFDGANRWTVLLPLTTMFVFSAANAGFVAPRAISTMWKLHVETVREDRARGSTAVSEPQDDDDRNKFESVRDGNTIRDEDGSSKSPELKALTNKFLAYHGASYACNMATIVTSVCYALCIAVKGL